MTAPSCERRNANFVGRVLLALVSGAIAPYVGLLEPGMMHDERIMLASEEASPKYKNKTMRSKVLT